MKIELEKILGELHSLATARGWQAVDELSAKLLSPEAAAAILIAQSSEGTAAAVRDWLPAILSEAKIETCALEGLAQDPAPALAANKIAAVFECGRMLAADEVEGIANAFFCRPASSYAIVFAGAEQIMSAEDLELIERAIWRLLVPEPKTDWNGQNLADYRCYLWSNLEVEDFLRARVERDKTELAAWFGNPIQQDEELARYQILSIINLAEAHIQTSDSTTKDSAHEARKLRNTQQLLTDVRQQLMRRLDTDASSIERQLVTSLQTLEHELKQGFLPYLQKQLPGIRIYSLKETEFRRYLHAYVSEEVARWEKKIRVELVARAEERIFDTAILFRGMDWKLVNDIASRHGNTQQYPNALLDQFANLKEIIMPQIPFAASTGSTEHDETDENWHIAILIPLAVVGSVVLMVGSMFGMLPGILAAGGGSALLLKKHANEKDKDYEASAQHAIRLAIRMMISAVEEETTHVLAPLRDYLSGEIKSLETLLEANLNELRKPTNIASASSLDLQTIIDLRSATMAQTEPLT
jgi:hypothetical protein